jgi:hypothetical protein
MVGGAHHTKAVASSLISYKCSSLKITTKAENRAGFLLPLASRLFF